MPFNQVNIDNRSRHLVRGRVLGFTTSKTIEFLEESLRYSYPLYSNLELPLNAGVAFMVELNGYLTFDVDSQVKLLEVNPFLRADFSKDSFSVVIPADSGYSIIGINTGGHFPDGTVAVVIITYNSPTGPADVSLLPDTTLANNQYSSGLSLQDVENTFPVDGFFRGPFAYPGYKPQQTSPQL